MRLLPAVLLLTACQELPSIEPPPARRVDFGREVLPLLASRCYRCHGPDAATRSADLRLDQRRGLFEARPRGAAVVVPGKPERSLLISRIRAGGIERMPPPESNLELTPLEIETLVQWVREGASYMELWSLVPPSAPVIPSTSNPAWARNPIDAFVLARLDAEGLTPSPEADPRALIRRVALDLTGLPPAPEDVEAYAAEPSEPAYLAYVDRLLATPAYGEHRARYWLDVARFADTHGYHFDNYRSIWPYRDYVIRAFNEDKPFDAFAVEQLAGDLLPGAGIEQRLATGFIRSALSTNETGVSEDEYAAIYAKDRVDTFGAAFLGLTVGCAACHDHKYDPILQRDYYALAAFFRNSTQRPFDDNDASAPPFVLLADGVTRSLVTEEAAGPARAPLLNGGRYDAPGELVEADVPGFLPALPAGVRHDRLALANWLFSAENPLPTRVAVNRFWAEVFGTGLVRSADDFGTAGEAPTHAELLDWLAVEFRASGFDVKALFRSIVSSSTYRQSGAARAVTDAADPEDRLLARFPRTRLDAETIRDLALAASGLLVPTLGGPSVKTYQPPELWESVSLPESNTYAYERDSGEALYRRSLYTFWKRQSPPPALQIFDAPTRERPVVQRERTNTPLQALVTLNDVQFVEAARMLAGRALSAAVETAERLDYIAMRVLSRRLSPLETATLSATLLDLLAHYDAEPERAAELLSYGDSVSPYELSRTELAAWTLVASICLNLDEALTK